MLHPGADLAVESGLLLVATLELPLGAAHAGDHAVKVLEDFIWAGAPFEGGVGCVLQLLLDEGALFLDDKVGGAEVLVKKLVWEAEEGLVLV